VALWATLALGIGAIAPAHAQFQGPNSPSTVVDDPATGTLVWTAPQAAAVSDDSAAIAGSPTGPTTHYLKATGFGFTIPAAAVIEGIEVDFERRGASAFDARVRLVKGGAIGSTDRSLPGDWNTLVDVVVTYGGSSDLWGETWTAADINAADFGFAISVFLPDGIALVDAISITVFYNTLCGNAVVDASENEQCDDGNTSDGDCCSSTCRFDAAGTPCPDALVCNGDETCDGIGVCDGGPIPPCDDGTLCTRDFCAEPGGCVNDDSPVTDCRTATKSTLIMRDGSPDTRDKLAWKWLKGAQTDQADFGLPTGTTQYALCVYRGATGPLASDYTVPGHATKWSPSGARGYRYKDKDAAADGIAKILLKGGAQNRSKIQAKGKGVNLADLDLAALNDNGIVVVQLVNDTNDICFESRFTASDFITFDDPTLFKAKAQ
jgi:cysteine-rich repeat protein